MGWSKDAIDSINETVGNALSPIADVMGLSDGDIKETISMLSNVPLLGDYFRMSDQMQSTADYMENRGLSWDKVKYPALLNNGQGSMTNGVRFISRNIERLYR